MVVERRKVAVEGWERRKGENIGSNKKIKNTD